MDSLLWATDILPEFRYRGIVLRAEDLRYAPHPDVIHPSVIATGAGWKKPLGRFCLSQARYLGMLMHHTAAGANNRRINDPCLLVHQGTAYLYINVGKRLNQQIALAVASL